MAIDVYLQIEGIKGESQDSAHRGWIECTEVHWSVVQPRSATRASAVPLVAARSGAGTWPRTSLQHSASSRI